MEPPAELADWIGRERPLVKTGAVVAAAQVGHAGRIHGPIVAQSKVEAVKGETIGFSASKIRDNISRIVATSSVPQNVDADGRPRRVDD
jgi:hypothetical protein